MTKKSSPRSEAISFLCWRYIQEDNALSAHDLADLLEVDVTTIYKHISKKPFWMRHARQRKKLAREHKQVRDVFKPLTRDNMYSHAFANY